MFNEPVREYFDYYTNNAAIESVSIPKAIGTYNGMPVIDSSDNVEVYFTLRNPKNYKLNFRYDDIGENPLQEHQPPDQDSTNLCSAKLNIEKSKLEVAEKISTSRIVNETIYLHIDDETNRKLEPSYNFSMFINSYPIPVKNPLLQTDEDGRGKYILCFFAPKTSETVHEDINKIWINSKSFDFKTDGTVDGTGFSSSASALYPLENGGLKFSDFQVPAGYQACYYNTEIPFYEEGDEIFFNITLEDKYGFKTTSSISNKAKKLSKPKIVNLDNDAIETGNVYSADKDTKLYTFKIYHDGTYDDDGLISGTAKIYYTIQAEQNSGVFGGTDTLTGSANGSVTLNLERGKYTISAYAQKNYCVDSDENTVNNVTIKEIPVYYVAPDGTYGSDGDNGSISKPFKRFADVMDNLQDEYTINNTVCKIYLKNNATDYYFYDETYMLEIPSGAVCTSFEISGYGGIKTVNLSKYENKAVLLVPSEKNVTFKDINITGGKSDSVDHSLIKNEGTLTLENCSITNNNCAGVVSNNEITIKNCTVTGNKNGGVEATGTINLTGKVVISGNTVKVEDGNGADKIVNCNLSLHETVLDIKDDKISSVVGLSSSSKIGITKETPPGTGDPKVLVDSWPVGLGNPWDIFTSDSSDFFVDYNDEKNKAVLKKQGALVEINQNESIVFTSDSSVPNVQKFTSDNEISIESYELYCGTDTVPKAYYSVTLESDKKIINVTTGSLKAGKYILNLKFEYNGNTYEANLSFTKN